MSGSRLHQSRFVEEGAKYEQELGIAGGRPCKGLKPIHPRPAICGQIHFTPAPGPAGTRRIYAITTLSGEITRRQLVATYVAPAEPEPSEVPNITVRRVADVLTVTWGRSAAKIRAAMPVDYNVDINLTDGRKLLDVVSRSHHQVTIPNVGPGRRCSDPRRPDVQRRHSGQGANDHARAGSLSGVRQTSRMNLPAAC